MKITSLAAAALPALLLLGAAPAQDPAKQEASTQGQEPDAAPAPEPAISSEVRRTDAGELVLVQQLRTAAPVEAVWAAYTTSEGWEAWAAPHAEVDLRVGGSVRTHYGADAAVGDPGTNTLRILNYVPEELLTLKAEPGERSFIPEEQAEKLSNVILFQALPDGGTRVVSYGIGYDDTAEMQRLIGFFTDANEGLLEKLRAHLEG